MSRSDRSPGRQLAGTPIWEDKALDLSPRRLSGELAPPRENSGRMAPPRENSGRMAFNPELAPPRENSGRMASPRENSGSMALNLESAAPPENSGRMALEMSPRHINMDMIRKVCRDEMRAEIEGLRAAMSDLEWRLQCSSLTINADLCDLKRQLQVRHVEKQVVETQHEGHLRHVVKPLKETRLESTTYGDFSLLRHSKSPLPEEMSNLSFHRHSPSPEVFQRNPQGILQRPAAQWDTSRESTLEVEGIPENSPLLRSTSERSVGSANVFRGISTSDVSQPSRISPDDVESPSPEYDKILENATQRRALKADCWGATTLMLVKDLAARAAGDKDRRSRIALITFCMILNLILQLGLILYLCGHVVLPQISKIQWDYKQFHKKAFISGHFQKQIWDSLEPLKDDVCGIAFSAPNFMCACIFLWWARCFIELSGTWKRVKECRSLPDLPPEVPTTFMVWRDDKTDLVVCLNRMTRFWLHLVVFLPRYIVGTAMLLMGTSFLTASASFADLILNTLAMSFVFDIDELLFGAFLPMQLAQEIEHTKMASPKHVRNRVFHQLTLHKVDPNNVNVSYYGNAVFVVAALILLLCWKRYQFVLPAYSQDLQMACEEYLQALMRVPCKPWDLHCFPE